MITRGKRFQRDRKRISPFFVIGGPAVTPVATIVGGKAHVVLNSPVVVSGIPTDWTLQFAGAGAQIAPTAVTVLSPTIVELTYGAHTVVATDVFTIPANTQSVKGIAGGSVSAYTKIF